MRSRTLAILCACFALSFSQLRAETFFGPSNGGNKLLVASNEAVIISSIMSSAGLLTGDVLISNSSYTVHLYPSGTTRLALGGPAELRIPSPCAVYFQAPAKCCHSNGVSGRQRLYERLPGLCVFRENVGILRLVRSRRYSKYISREERFWLEPGSSHEWPAARWPG